MGLMALSNGPWTLPLDWDIRATHYGETRKTFRHHVRPTRREIHPLLGSFTQFLQLPLELQQHILSFCESATLFQLMRVSSTTREEAKKLFWSEPTTRYYFHGFWLLSGGYTGHTTDDVEALALMQRIEIDFECLPSILFTAWEDGDLQWLDKDREGLPSDYSEQQVAKFWATLRRRFPAVTHVILSDQRLRDPGAPPPDELTQLAQGAPDTISTAVSSLQREDRHPQLSRRLWQQIYGEGSSSTSKLVDLSWTPRRVLPPLKELAGPVGTHRLQLHHQGEYIYKDSARRILLIQATEAYYLHTQRSPCICPFPRCGLQFELPGQWTAHYLTFANDAAHEGEIPPPPCKALQALFDQHAASLTLMRQQMADERERLQAAWGEEGSQQRTDATHVFLQQLHDPLYACEKFPEESCLWRGYQEDMNDEDMYD